MKNNFNLKAITIVEAMIALVWIVIVLLFGTIDDPGFYLWGGVIFAIIACGLTILGTCFFLGAFGKVDVEVTGVPFYFLGVFLMASLVSNLVFSLRYNGESNRFVIILNLLLYLFYGIILLGAYYYITHVGEAGAVLSEKVSDYEILRSALSDLLVSAQEPETKAKLKELKELVDYSSNISVAGAKTTEEIFMRKLNEIQQLILTNADKEVVEKVIQQAVELWKKRNVINTNR